jgi:hypothetical protein
MSARNKGPSGLIPIECSTDNGKHMSQDQIIHPGPNVYGIDFNTFYEVNYGNKQLDR